MSYFVDLHEFRTIYCGCCGTEIQFPVYCKDRFCDICSWGRRARVRRRIQEMVKKSPILRGYGWSHLVLTIENSQSIKEGLIKLTQSFRKLRQTKFWRSRVAGGAFVLEVKNGSKGYHVHLHAVIYNKFLSKKQLNKAWEKSSGSIITFIKRTQKNMILHYLTKYLSKPNEINADMSDMGRELARYRLFQPFGIWHGIKVEKTKRPFNCPSCNEINWIPDFELYTSEKYYDPADRVICEVKKPDTETIPMIF